MFYICVPSQFDLFQKQVRYMIKLIIGLSNLQQKTKVSLQSTKVENFVTEEAYFLKIKICIFVIGNASLFTVSEQQCISGFFPTSICLLDFSKNAIFEINTYCRCEKQLCHEPPFEFLLAILCSDYPDTKDERLEERSICGYSVQF